MKSPSGRSFVPLLHPDDRAAVEGHPRPGVVHVVHVAHGLVRHEEPEPRDARVDDGERDPQHRAPRHPSILGMASPDPVPGAGAGSASREHASDDGCRGLRDLERDEAIRCPDLDAL